MAEQPTTNPVVEATPNTVPVVPDDWAALGAKRGYDPKVAVGLRLFIVGPSGEGKTTFISSIPDNLILDFDDGANAIPGGHATRIYVKDYASLDAIVDKLLVDAKNNNRRFRRVTFDTVDELIAMVKHKLEEEKGVEDITDYRSEGYGYNLILQRFWSKILDIEQAGYAWAIVGHVKTKDEVDPASKKMVTKIRESVYPGVAKKILTKADFKLTVYYIPESKEVTGAPRRIPNPAGGPDLLLAGEKKTISVPTYYLNSMSTESTKSGENKSRGVPSMERKFELPLVEGWKAFVNRYDSAVVVERAKQGS